MIRVFEWEIEISRALQELPRSGVLYDFLHFWSYPPKFAWVIAFGIVAFLLIKFWPRLNLLIATCVLSAGAGDLISYRLVKRIFERPRPGSLISGCFSPDCWGFVSSHATNIAAASTVLCFYDRRNIFWCLPIWLLVSGSRVYLGDHFPLDVLFGGLLGILIGLFAQFIVQTLTLRKI